VANEENLAIKEEEKKERNAPSLTFSVIISMIVVVVVELLGELFLLGLPQLVGRIS
jgi:hypothetical protein